MALAWFKPRQFPLQPTFPLLGWGEAGLACEIKEKRCKLAGTQVLGKTVAARVRKRAARAANPLLPCSSNELRKGVYSIRRDLNSIPDT